LNQQKFTTEDWDRSIPKREPHTKQIQVHPNFMFIALPSIPRLINFLREKTKNSHVLDMQQIIQKELSKKIK
jgi:hypothetical protein